MLPHPWRDPQSDPPAEYDEVLVSLDTGRVVSSRYHKGRFSTHVPVLGWQPMPPSVQELLQGKSKSKSETAIRAPEQIPAEESDPKPVKKPRKKAQK